MYGNPSTASPLATQRPFVLSEGIDYMPWRSHNYLPGTAPRLNPPGSVASKR